MRNVGGDEKKLDGYVRSMLFENKNDISKPLPTKASSIHSNLSSSPSSLSGRVSPMKSPQKNNLTTEKFRQADSNRNGFTSGIPLVSLLDDDFSYQPIQEGLGESPVRMSIIEPSFNNFQSVPQFSTTNSDTRSQNAVPGFNILSSNTGSQPASLVPVSGPAPQPIFTQEQNILGQWVVIFGCQTSPLPDNSNNTNHVRSSSTSSSNGVVYEVLRRFQEYGEIVDYIVGDGNWMCIRFSDVYSADRAVAVSATGLFLSSHTLLGAHPLTPQLVSSLNINLNLATAADRNKNYSSLEVDRFGVSSVESSAGMGINAHDISTTYDKLQLLRQRKYGKMAIQSSESFRDSKDIFVPPPSKRKNICTKIVEFFFVF